MVQMVVDKSRFIAVACHVETIEDVKTMIGSLKKSNRDAKHIAYAYRLGEDYSTAKHNDDGEPAGSAGLPIYEAIKNNNVTNTLVAVVRYFGGKELGKSKLTRTYGAVANGALKNSQLFVMKYCNIYEMKVSYADFAGLGKHLTEKGYHILEQNNKETMPLIKVAIPEDIADKQVEEIRARVRGASFITKVGNGYYRFKPYTK
jgi:uncharacterized YigZ family protein